jgi:plastocyanin
MFTPSTLRVARGTVVTVRNDDTTTHTWTADAGAWDSGHLAPGAMSQHTFSTSGTFTYHCSIHPSMTGTVAVS